MVSERKKWLMFFFVALAPTICLLARGVVWGADSFAFMSVACGKPFGGMIGHPFFAQFVPMFQCNFYLIVGVMFVFYFVGLLGLWVFGNRVLKSEGYLLPFVVGSLSPLFFFEAIRFENQLFGFSLALVGLGLFTLYLSVNNRLVREFNLFLCVIAYIIACLCWLPSIILAIPCLLLLGFSDRIKQTIVLVVGLLGLFIYKESILFSFTQLFTNQSLVAEEIPLIGIIFVLHIVHLYKYVPKNFYWWNILLIGIGIVKSKYMFLSIPFLAMGVIRKDKEQGLIVRGNRIPLIPVCLYLLIGFCLMGMNMFPTLGDVSEVDYIISRAEANEIPIYNDWGEGWLFEWRGYNTPYKVSIPQPDWNKLETPFYAYTKFPEDLPVCERLTKYTYFCQ